MCIAPAILSDGTQAACRRCWQCVDQKINDWAGRCVAEGKTSVASYAVTLTYGRDKLGEKLHERAVVLTYSDVQKYLKLLRRHRYTVRYFVTGEFGGAKGRTHWHIILFFGPRAPLYRRGKLVEGADMSPVPPLSGVHQHGHWVENCVGERFNHHRVDEAGNPVYVNGKPALWWPYGFSYFEPVNQNSVRYNCKYVQKDLDDAEAQGHLAMSKKPPIGAAWFAQEAERYVASGLAPQTLEYRFMEVRRQKRDGSDEVVPFRLKDRSAELFLEHYVHVWRERRGDAPMPESALVEGWMRFGILNGDDEDAMQRARIADIEEREREAKSAARVAKANRHGPRKAWADMDEAERERAERLMRQRIEADEAAFNDAWDLRAKRLKEDEQARQENEARERSITEPYEWRGDAQRRAYRPGRRSGA